jgi:hypothetical protein
MRASGYGQRPGRKYPGTGGVQTEGITLTPDPLLGGRGEPRGEPNQLYDLEVVAIEAGHNQTISTAEFRTAAR